MKTFHRKCHAFIMVIASWIYSFCQSAGCISSPLTLVFRFGEMRSATRTVDISSRNLSHLLLMKMQTNRKTNKHKTLQLTKHHVEVNVNYTFAFLKLKFHYFFIICPKRLKINTRTLTYKQLNILFIPVPLQIWYYQST